MKTLIAALALAGFLGAAQAADDATFQGLGGKPGIEKIVSTLIPLIMADGRIKETFEGINLKKVAAHLEVQFCELAGGPCKFEGRSMAEIHDGLNITNAQFNALAEDLQVAMDKVGVAPRFQNKLLAKLAPMQRDVVTK